LGGRNGTKELLEAMQYVKSPIKLLVRIQNGSLRSDDPRVEIIHGSVPYETLWTTGDVLIFPEKFGGSFLPMQEAFASGLAVMASDRFPTNSWLPKELLIPVKGYKKERIGAEFDCAILNPKNIAKKIDEIYGTDISKYSKMGKKWAEENSWEKLAPKYKAL
jgi:glycosyltransferase involved in cell wall biosynthesis